MKVLLLSQAYPPHPEVGGLRSFNVAHAFLEAGHSVTVITEAVPGVPAQAPKSDRLRLITVDAGAQRAARIGRLLRKARALPDQRLEASGPPATQLPTNTSPGPLRRLVIAALSFPDEYNHLIKPCQRVASTVLAEGGADLIYSSSPPVSLHWCALRLKRRFGIPWVAEFRDPWVHPWTDRLTLLHPLTRAASARLERRMLQSADLVVTATEAARVFTLAKLPRQLQDRVVVARNGVPEWPGPPPGPAAGPFRMVHVGSFYMGRNPAGFLEGLARVIKRRGLAPGNLQVELIGKSRSYRGHSMAALIEGYGLSQYVRLEDWLPHAVARQRQLSADVLVLFAQHQPLQVPNKLYEYLATGRRILAFVDREGESAALLRDGPNAELVYESDVERIAATIERLYDQGPAARAAGRRVVFPEALLSRAQMKTLVAEVDRRFGRGA